MNEQNSPPEQPSEQPADAQANETRVQREPAPQDPRRRLRELLAIPERDRSDAQWDEIIALEIQLAPENRVSSGQGQPGRHQDQGRGNPQQARRSRPGPGGNKPSRRFSKKSKRRPGVPPIKP